MDQVTQPDRKKSSYLLELERRANDLLRVYNPTDKDHVVIWDKRSGGKIFRVAAKGEAILVRYIAEKYIKEMYWKIISEKAQKAILEENQKRVEKGIAEMDKTERSGEQLKFEAPYYKPSNEESRKIIALLYMGVENEYGIDRDYEIQEEKQASGDFKDVLKDVQTTKDTVPLQNTTQNTPQNSTTILEPGTKGDNGFVCDFPDCGFTTETKIALFGHKRSHQKESQNV